MNGRCQPPARGQERKTFRRYDLWFPELQAPTSTASAVGRECVDQNIESHGGIYILARGLEDVQHLAKGVNSDG